MKALIDSGANSNCKSEKCMSTLGIPYSALKTSEVSSLVDPPGHPLPIVGTMLLNISIQGLSIPTSVHVRSLRVRCILGVDFLQDSRVGMDCANKTISVYDGLVMAQLISNLDRDSMLLLSKKVTRPPRSESFVPVCVHGQYVGQTLITESWPPLENCMIVAANSLMEPHVIKS